MTPSQAANSRPLRKAAPLPIAATTAQAVALGPLSDGLENGLFVHAGASHDDPQLWTWRFQAGHHIEQVVAVAQKHQINVLLRTDVRQ